MRPRFPRILLVLLALGVLTRPLFAVDTTLVAAGSTWRYKDNGSDQGTAWRAAAFNDSAWSSGPAQLGYGDGDEATEVSYGPDPNFKYVTTYFRRTFNVADPSAFNTVKMRTIRDDGVVVYINGTEVWRSNMAVGTVNYLTFASTTTGGDESTFIPATVSPSVLVAGQNVITAEIHQADRLSSDISFDLELLGSTDAPSANLLREPYLQLGTPTSIRIRWRTDIATDSRVQYGTSANALNLTALVTTLTTEHEVTLSGLSPSTRYYYSVGSSSQTLAGGDGDTSYTFKTFPTAGSTSATRIWVLGDSGTASNSAAAVRDAYLNFIGSAQTNFWLMLGDNAYDAGTDSDYQNAVFDMYPSMLRSSVLWPTIGNHDTAEIPVAPPDLPYFQMFTLPTAGEAGGVASGTEKYYSFDYANAHFICLDSMVSDRSPTGPMLTWLRNDLESTSQQWIIAFWHHPPYSKGSHDSDDDVELVEMRQNALPILEEYGVDLVLSGHSHSYERSFLIDSHYGSSSTFVSSMKKNGGSGQTETTGAYTKPTLGMGSHEGAVYVVAGSSGTTSGGLLNHPAMYIGLNNLGSLVLDLNGRQLDVKFLRENGVVADHFTILKGSISAPSGLSATAASSTQINLAWTDVANETGYRVERCAGASCTNFAQIVQLGANVTSYPDTNISGTYTYRVIAFNATETSGPSNTATATTLAPVATPTDLSATAASSTQINLAWTDAATNETGYRVERCVGASCTDFAQIAQLAANANSYSDSVTGTYTYRVIAFNATDTSAPSNTATATTLAPVATPTGLSATAASSTQINLAWTDVATNETGYRVERCAGASCTNFAEIVQLGPNANAYSDSVTGTYTYRVIAFNATDTSSPSNTASATTLTPVATPTGLSATAASSTQINLAWTDAATNETGYRVERCAGASCTNFAQIAQLGANANSYSDSVTGTYTYRVIAFNTTDTSSPSNTATATTLAPVATPTSLSATAASSTQINLAWTDAATNETGYRVERCTGASCTNFAQIAQLAANSNSYSDSVTGTYTYRVIAFNTTDTSSPSNTATATTLAPVATPTSLSATAASSTQINLAWTDAATNETGYRVERCAGASCTNFAQIAQLAANANAYSDSVTGTYTYRVIAFNATDTSAPSNTATATTLAPVATPTGLSATAASSTQINLAWTDAATNESGYRVERCAGASCANFAEIAQLAANANSYSDSVTGTYTYRVIAFNATDTSAPSNSASATTLTPPATPTNLSATAASSTQINLAWTDVATNETGYRVERCAGASCTNFAQIAQLAANANAYADTNVTGTYTYRVIAFNATDTSLPSNTATATTLETCTSTPTIVKQPQSVTIASGGTATLHVAAIGASTLTYQWYAGAQPLSGETNDFLTVTPGATATYSVRVTSGCGSVDSVAVTITVSAP